MTKHPIIKHLRLNDQGKIVVDKQRNNKGATLRAGELQINVGGQWRKVARLMIQTFECKQLSKHERVEYVDGNPLNVQLSNLRRCNRLISNPTGKGSGGKKSDKTRALIGSAMMGVKHPSFKGYYSLNDELFTSAKLASIVWKNGERRIKKLCLKGIVQNGVEYAFIPVGKKCQNEKIYGKTLLQVANLT